jgi:hypothetical protein
MLIWEELFSLIKLGQICQSKLTEKLPFCRRLQMSSFYLVLFSGPAALGSTLAGRPGERLTGQMKNLRKSIHEKETPT